MSKRNENRPGYKKTKVGWIPKEWKGRYLLQTGCKVIDGDRGKEYPKQHEFELAGHCLFLNAGNVTKEGFRFLDCHFITKEKDSKLRKGKLKKGDIVITTRGTVGSFALYNKKIEFDHIRINSGMAIIRTRTNNTNILHTFLYTLLRSHVIENQIKKIVFGSAQPQLTIGLINRFYLSLPPLPEQKKIAEILSAWDRAVEQVGKLIDVKQRLKKGLMQQLLTGRMRFPEFNHEIHEREKGELPEGWREMRFSKIFKRVNLKRFQIPKKNYRELGKYPVVDQGQEKIVAWSNAEPVTNPLPVIIFGDHTREIKWIDFPFIPGADGTIILIPADETSTVFAYYLLCNTHIVNLGYSRHFSELKSKKFLVPQIPEQIRIATILSTCDREIELLKKKQGKLKEQKKGLMQKLLIGEVRVKT